MRKQFLLFTLLLVGLLMLPGKGKAAVTPIAGNVDPEISTEAAPKWYTVMSSHITAADRQNRFLVWDGDRLRTEKFDLGIPEDQLEDKYLWRLEQGSADNKVYIVNKTGLRIFAPDGLDPTKNTSLTVNESGVEWEMKLTAETGQPDCADKQYCFNLLSAKTTPAYLNAMDFQNDIADKKYGITIYNAGVHQASGWFFYEANVQETTQYTVTYDTPENGTIQVTNAQDEVITSTNKVDEGTVLTISAIPAPGYVLDYLKVNDTPLTESTYTVTGNIVITAAFVKEPVVFENKAIAIPQTNYSSKIGYRLQVAETILGDRSNTATSRLGKSFTLSAWINMDKITSDSKNKGAVIMGHGPQVHMNYNGSLVLGITETGELKVISGDKNNVNQQLSTDISLNTWTYLTLIYDNDTHKIKVYMDGVLAGEEIQLSQDLILFLDDPCIFFVGGMGFSGMCDEMQFFNKALTEAEVKQAFKKPADMPNLIAWYDFDNLTGENDGSFLNKSTASEKVSEKAVFYKYTGSQSSDPGLISGSVERAIPTLVDGRTPSITKYTVTLPTEVANGLLTVMNGEVALVAGENEVEEGTVLTITATPAEGYQVKSIKVNDVVIEGNTFVLEKESTITVEFTNKLIVKYSISENGSILVKNANTGTSFNNGDEFDKNSFIAIGLTPVEGYEVSVFNVNGEDKKEKLKNNVYLITNCQTNLDIKVEFAKKQLNVAFSSNSFGTLTVKKNNVNIESNTQVEYGTELTIIAEPVELATLNVFTINGVDKLNDIKDALQMTITTKEALDIKAEFAPLWKVTYNITGEGTVKIEDEKGNVHENGASTIAEGSAVTLTLTPETGYELSDLMIDGTSYMHLVTDNQFRLEMDADYTFDVVFIKGTSLQNTSADAVSVRYAAGTLHVIGMNAGDRLDIYDIAGNYVRTSEVADTNVSDLADGCYLVKVTTGNTIKTVKFIKK